MNSACSSTDSLPMSQGTNKLLDKRDQFCRDNLKWAVSKAMSMWDFEHQALICRAIRITGNSRTKITEAVQRIFPVQESQTIHSRAFNDLLSEHFPLGQLFEPMNALSVSRFRDSQHFFRTVAIHVHDFFQLFPQGDADQLVAYLEQQQVFVQSGLKENYKDTFYDLLKSLHVSIRNPQLAENQFKDCFCRRIYTLHNAMTAVQEPQKMVDTICKHNGVTCPVDKVAESRQQISHFGRIFFIDSIRLHYNQLFLEQVTDHNSFVDNLHRLCLQFVPFLRRATLSYSMGEVDYRKDCSTILKTFSVKGDNDTAPIACTLLQELLRTFGYAAEIYTRRNISPKLTLSFAHAVLLVADSVNHREVVVDPTYHQFLYGLHLGQELPSDVLELKDGNLDGFIDWLLDYRQTPSPGLPKDHPLFTISDDEFRAHFKTVWGLEGSERVTLNRVACAIFTPQKEECSGDLAVRGLLEVIGLSKTLARQTLDQKAVSILQKAKVLTSFQLFDELSGLDDHRCKLFLKALKLDPRPVLAGLFPFKTVGYLMAIRECVNPSNNSDAVALYGCAGSDLSPLIAFNVSTLFMVERTVVNGLKLQKALDGQQSNELVQHSETYKAVKFLLGGALAGHSEPDEDYRDQMINIEQNIAVELASLGVDLTQVKVQDAPDFNGITISFPWSYHGETPKVRSITWVTAHLEEPEAYPPGLKKLIGSRTIDIYYQKAANLIPVNYGKFLPQIAHGLKEGGFLLTSDYDMFGNRHAPDVHLQSEGMQFSTPLQTPLIAAYQNLFRGTLPPSWIFDFQGKLEDRIIPPREEYYTFVDIRKKSQRKAAGELV